MKIALTIVFLCLSGLVYQNYQKAESSRINLREADTKIEQLRQQVTEVGPLTRQVAILQQHARQERRGNQ